MIDNGLEFIPVEAGVKRKQAKRCPRCGGYHHGAGVTCRVCSYWDGLSKRSGLRRNNRPV